MDGERRNKILELKEKGFSYTEICHELNCDKSLVAYYCGENKWQKKKESIIEKENSKIEYEQIVCNLIKNSDNINQVCILLGKRPTNINYIYIKNIIDKYNIDISHFKINVQEKPKKYKEIDDILCEHSPYKTISSLRARLIRDGIKEEKCECCGNTEWLGKKIPLQLHHVNGVRDDNRIENLQLLCPNCHAFTDTYCGSNIKNKSKYVHKSKTCKMCGKTFFGNNKFCSTECLEEYKKIEREKKGILTPTKEDILIAAKEEKTMKDIEKRFGMGDNGIRKWCDKYGLPRKIKELKKISENACL